LKTPTAGTGSVGNERGSLGHQNSIPPHFNETFGFAARMLVGISAE
jgi:hypothetical protein